MALKHHDLFRSVHGNPTSIRFLAACFSNKEKPKSLLELYARLLHEKTLVSVVGNEKEGKVDRTKSKPEISKNNLSLNFSTEAIIQVLEEANPKSLNLFYFLGCLPGGLMPD